MVTKMCPHSTQKCSIQESERCLMGHNVFLKFATIKMFATDNLQIETSVGNTVLSKALKGKIISSSLVCFTFILLCSSLDFCTVSYIYHC